MRHKKQIIPHYHFPKRKIVKRETQAGVRGIVLACQHWTPGVPMASTSRFYPCKHCFQIVEQHRQHHEAQIKKAPKNAKR